MVTFLEHFLGETKAKRIHGTFLLLDYLDSDAFYNCKDPNDINLPMAKMKKAPVLAVAYKSHSKRTVRNLISAAQCLDQNSSSASMTTDVCVMTKSCAPGMTLQST